MDYNERFEMLAELFYKKHGFYPLGKDVMYPRPVDDRECIRMWECFLAELDQKEAEKEIKQITND